MAMALEPESGMFPETLIVPFVVAPELKDLAEDVLASYDEFRAIADAIDEYGVRIRYVFETKEFDPVKEELKPHTIAKVTKAGPLWRVLGETELVIQFRQWFWDHFTEQERRGVLHHEWSHVELDDAGKVSLREHDVEEFSGTARRFGPRRHEHASLFKAFLDWSHEQEHPTPAPLRRVDMGAVLDEVVDRVNAGELGPDITASRGRPPADDDQPFDELTS